MTYQLCNAVICVHGTGKNPPASNDGAHARSASGFSQAYLSWGWCCYAITMHRPSSILLPDSTWFENRRLHMIIKCWQLTVLITFHNMASNLLRKLKSFIIQNKLCFFVQLYKDLLHPSVEEEKRRCKLKRLVQSPNSYFMDVKCPGTCSACRVCIVIGL